MYQLKEVTVTASVSKDYNKAEFTATAMVESDEDIESLKDLCRHHAVDLLNTFPVKSEPKQEQRPRQQYTAPRANPTPNRVYQQPRQVQQPQQRQEVRMASEKQIAYLKSFGYDGDENLTFQQADTLLKQYKGEL